jgi:hypothetical protein
MVEQTGPEIDIEENVGGGAVAHIAPMMRDTITVVDRLQDKAWPMKDIANIYSGVSFIVDSLVTPILGIASGFKKTENTQAVQSMAHPTGRNNYRSNPHKDTNWSDHTNLFSNWHLIGSSGWTAETTTQTGDICAVAFGDVIDQVPGALVVAYNNQNGKASDFTSYARVKQTVDMTGVKYLRMNVECQGYAGRGRSFLKISIGGKNYFVFDFPISGTLPLYVGHLNLSGSKEVIIGVYSVGSDATSSSWKIDEVRTSLGESDVQHFAVSESVTVTNT